MDFKQLRCFRQVYTDRSIRKAAENLYVSQQALSRMLMNLEEEFQVKLFSRGSRGVVPTEWGELLARETEDILPRLDRLTVDIRKRNPDLGGSVRIGALLGHLGKGTNLEICALDNFRKAYPEIELSYVNGTPGDLADMLREGKIDFSFSTFPGDLASFRCWKLFDYGWCAAMGKEHSLAGRESLTVRDLAYQTLIFPSDAWYDRMQIRRALPGDAQPQFIDAAGFFYDIVFQQLLPMKAIMLCTDFQAKLLNPAIIECVPFETDLLNSQIFLIYLAEAPLSTAARLAISYLLASWGFLLPQGIADDRGEKVNSSLLGNAGA